MDTITLHGEAKPTSFDALLQFYRDGGDLDLGAEVERRGEIVSETYADALTAMLITDENGIERIFAAPWLLDRMSIAAFDRFQAKAAAQADRRKRERLSPTALYVLSAWPRQSQLSTTGAVYGGADWEG